MEHGPGAVRITGVQHPAPQLTCLVERDAEGISLTAPYANPVYNGVSLIPAIPRTELWGLLYVQVIQADGQAFRNILLARKRMVLNRKSENVRGRDSLPRYGLSGWSEAEIEMRHLFQRDTMHMGPLFAPYGPNGGNPGPYKD